MTIEVGNLVGGGHGWDYLPLHEEWIVSYLIKNRMKLDPSYSCSEAIDIFASDGAFSLQEEVICTYADLDA